MHDFSYNIYLTVDSEYPALFTDSPQVLRASDAKLAQVASKMPSPFAAVINKEISQLIKQAVPQMHEEGGKVRFGSFKVLSF